VDDSPGGVALNVIARFEELERQQNLLMEANQALAFQVEQLQSDRDHALADLQMAREQMIAVMQKQPTDPKVLREMWLLEREQARKRHIEARAKFKESLENMPKGSILNEHNEAMPVGVNGFYFIAQPGMNKDVPAAFVEEWANRTIAEAAATELNRKLKFNGTKFPHTNEIQRAMGKAPIWSDERGSLAGMPSAAEQFGG